MNTRNSVLIVAIVLLSGLVALLSMPAAFAQKGDAGLMSQINKAGRQRMLSQRIAKAYFQIGLNVRRDEAGEQLKAAVNDFDSQLVSLKNAAPSAPVADAVRIVDELWKPYREAVLAPYSQEALLKVMSLSDDVLAASQTVVEKLEAQSTERVARIVNLAGRQRMLSQRLAKYYLLRELGARPPLVTQGIETVRKEFMDAQAILRNAPETNADARKLVEYMDTQWQLMDYSLSKGHGMMAEFVVLSADKILNSADVLTGIYEMQGRAPLTVKQ
ncbi:MAG: type IV pili methyl-accepting chemotaxis transducer N-terminal domain-containing protein [Gammaproteobacteria bacterium]|nr:type IV pili methyl-accepting chemotaxis transducer N-terminal domain-containing protein [Gammaproteobacteria bacterium]